MVILAIGGAVIKTARKELKAVVAKGEVDVLIHNGGSLFHDFQLATEKLSTHSHPLKELLQDYEVNRPASELVWKWIKGKTLVSINIRSTIINLGITAPKDSITALAEKMGKTVLMFTGLGTDFWQLFDIDESEIMEKEFTARLSDWELIGRRAWFDFNRLCLAMATPFHFINMGSAVIHPEVFTKALAVVKPKKFRATVVDFQEMYRPRTRVANYGAYCKTTHKKFLTLWAKKGLKQAILETNVFDTSSFFI